MKAIELLSKDAAISGGLAHQIKSRETARFLMTKHLCYELIVRKEIKKLNYDKINTIVAIESEDDKKTSKDKEFSSISVHNVIE